MRTIACTGAALIAIASLDWRCPAQSTTIDWVTVGDPNNPGDSSNGGSVGAVHYIYRIGKYEVTNAQYVVFLNAKPALGDPLGLFNTQMQSQPRGGIVRTGSGSVDDPFIYSTKPSMDDKPVNYVGWYDCVRFVNWLNNGQGTGGTESGAYILMGNTPIPSNANLIARQPGAKVWLPNNSEWHKAALYEPGASGNGYWAFATRSDTVPPIIATATSEGDIANPGPFVVNYFKGADWNGQDGNVTTVGSAGPLSFSHYGTADMNGNVFEWTEDLISGVMRARRGGSFVEDWNVFYGGGFGSATPTIEIASFGLRVASLPCAPDISGDGLINASDLLMVINAWGPCTGCAADVSGDGVVNAADLLAVINAWGSCT